MKKWVLLILIFIILVCVGVATYVFSRWSQPVTPGSQVIQTFVIPKGSGVVKIGTALQEAGLIRSSQFFRYVVWKEGLGNKIQAGSYRLSSGQTPQEIAKELTRGTNDVWVTVLEGWRAEEVADIFQEKLTTTFDRDEFLKLAKPEEGRLFPDTYLLPTQATARQVIQLLLRTHTQKLPKDWSTVLQAQGRTPEQALIMASLVQREAKTLPTMRMIAGILWKRLDNGWPLQVDATLQYVKGYSATEKTWWSEPLAAWKALASPYNTYLNTGLPPAPICSPGSDALVAVTTPTSSEYWYYISDLQGNMHYATTLQEHNANVEKYLR